MSAVKFIREQMIVTRKYTQGLLLSVPDERWLEIPAGGVMTCARIVESCLAGGTHRGGGVPAGIGENSGSSSGGRGDFTSSIRRSLWKGDESLDGPESERNAGSDTNGPGSRSAAGSQ